MSYIAYRTKTKFEIDGNLNKEIWKSAPKSPRFVGIVDGESAIYDTKSAVLWDDSYLYIGFWIEEPFIRADMYERDDLLFNENNVEIMIDGVDAYYELQVNAMNTIYEVFLIWRDAYIRGGKFDIPEFDIYNKDVCTFGGNHDRHPQHFWTGTHPRGLRWAFRNWDLPGLKTAVSLNGTLNDATDVDIGWTVEIALPWEGLKWLANDRALPPKKDDIWNIHFSRFEKLYTLNKSVGWSWNQVGSDDNHRPEKFTPIQFSTEEIEESY